LQNLPRLSKLIRYVLVASIILSTWTRYLESCEIRKWAFLQTKRNSKIVIFRRQHCEFKLSESWYRRRALFLQARMR
jgi:hypothetical protein